MSPTQSFKRSIGLSLFLASIACGIVSLITTSWVTDFRRQGASITIGVLKYSESGSASHSGSLSDNDPAIDNKFQLIGQIALILGSLGLLLTLIASVTIAITINKWQSVRFFRLALMSSWLSGLCYIIGSLLYKLMGPTFTGDYGYGYSSMLYLVAGVLTEFGSYCVCWADDSIDTKDIIADKSVGDAPAPIVPTLAGHHLAENPNEQSQYVSQFSDNSEVSVAIHGEPAEYSQSRPISHHSALHQQFASSLQAIEGQHENSLTRQSLSGPTTKMASADCVDGTLVEIPLHNTEDDSHLQTYDIENSVSHRSDSGLPSRSSVAAVHVHDLGQSSYHADPTQPQEYHYHHEGPVSSNTNLNGNTVKLQNVDETQEYGHENSYTYSQ